MLENQKYKFRYIIFITKFINLLLCPRCLQKLPLFLARGVAISSRKCAIIQIEKRTSRAKAALKRLSRCIPQSSVLSVTWPVRASTLRSITVQLHRRRPTNSALSVIGGKVVFIWCVVCGEMHFADVFVTENIIVLFQPAKN